MASAPIPKAAAASVLALRLDVLESFFGATCLDIWAPWLGWAGLCSAMTVELGVRSVLVWGAEQQPGSRDGDDDAEQGEQCCMQPAAADGEQDPSDVRNVAEDARNGAAF